MTRPRVVGCKDHLFFAMNLLKHQKSVEFIYAVWSYGCRNLLSIKGVCARAYVIDLVFKVCVCGHVCACAGMCACACTCECVCDKSNLDSFQSFLLPENMKLLFAALFGAAAAVPLPHVGVTKSLLPPALIRLNVGAIKVRQNAVSCTFHFYFRYLLLSCQQIDARIHAQRAKMYTPVLLDLLNHDTVLNSAQSNTFIYMDIYTYTFYALEYYNYIDSYSTAKLQSSYNLKP